MGSSSSPGRTGRSLAALACLPLTACATLTAPRTEYLQVQSEPPGASVRVNGIGGGCTPAAVQVDKHRPPIVQVSMAGQASAYCSTEMSAAPRYVVADVILCVLLFPIGCISFMDAGGAWDELNQPVCIVRFAPGTQPPAAPPPPTPGPPSYPPPTLPPLPPPEPQPHD
ncbi:MAG: hypothetical protein QM765_46090 [Myxococcales bacterium]